MSFDRNNILLIVIVLVFAVYIYRESNVSWFGPSIELVTDEPLLSQNSTDFKDNCNCKVVGYFKKKSISEMEKLLIAWKEEIIDFPDVCFIYYFSGTVRPDYKIPQTLLQQNLYIYHDAGGSFSEANPVFTRDVNFIQGIISEKGSLKLTNPTLGEGFRKRLRDCDAW